MHTIASSRPQRNAYVRTTGTEGALKDLCDWRMVHQEFKTADVPKMNWVVERGLDCTQGAAQASCLEAPRLFPGVQLPASAHLWAEGCFWVREIMNPSSTTVNPDQRPPCELFYGTLPPLTLLLFLLPGHYRVRRGNKTAPKAEIYVCVNGGSYYPSDSITVLLQSVVLTYNRDVTWEYPREPFVMPTPVEWEEFQAVCPPPPPPPQP